MHIIFGVFGHVVVDHNSIPITSMPRAAISVATSTRYLPFLNRLMLHAVEKANGWNEARPPYTASLLMHDKFLRTILSAYKHQYGAFILHEHFPISDFCSRRTTNNSCTTFSAAVPARAISTRTEAAYVAWQFSQYRRAWWPKTITSAGL